MLYKPPTYHHHNMYIDDESVCGFIDGPTICLLRVELNNIFTDETHIQLIR